MASSINAATATSSLGRTSTLPPPTNEVGVLRGALPYYLRDTAFADVREASVADDSAATTATHAPSAMRDTGSSNSNIGSSSSNSHPSASFIRPAVRSTLADTVSDVNKSSSPSSASALNSSSIQYELPMAFSSTDCSSHLEISNNGLTVSYVGRGRGDTDAASVRATKPISPYCGTFYYEVTIRSKGRSGFIGIGLSSNQFSLTRLPGWDAYSWGYHGDDGHCFGGQGTGHPFGPIYSQGDVAGCGINWSDGSIFFTKNGIHLGTPFKGIKIGTNVQPLTSTVAAARTVATANGQELIVPNLYPTIGMRSPEEKVDVNFGKSPFKYDIVSHIQTEKALTWRSILKSPLTLHTEHSAASASATAPVSLSSLSESESDPTSHINAVKVSKVIAAAVTARNPSQIRSATTTTTTSSSSSSIKTPGVLSSSSLAVPELVLSYLIHAGHQRTAASLVQNLVTLSNPAITPDAPSLPTEVDESIERMNNVMLRRKSIRQSILIGDIDTAVNDAKQHFPSVFQRHADLYLRLRCRTVIELVCQVTNMVDPGQTLHELVTTNATATATAAAAVNILAGDDDGDDDSDIDTDQNEQPSPLATNGSTSNGAGEPMMLDSAEDEDKAVVSVKPIPHSRRPSKTQCQQTAVELYNTAIQLSKDINAEYSDNHNPQVADTLRSTFAIFAYPNPMQSPISHNLDPSEREPLANELDEAILESLGMPSVAPLKMVAKQAIVATGELVRHGNAMSSLLHPYNDLLRNH